MLGVIGTDCVGSCYSNYNMITTMTARLEDKYINLPVQRNVIQNSFQLLSDLLILLSSLPEVQNKSSISCFISDL